MNEIQKEIQRQFRQSQEKYVYYILALTVSSIGFAIYKTNGIPLKCSQIPLGIAVLLWSISIFCGLSFLKYTISILYANNTYYDILQGRYPEIGNVEWKQEAAIEGAKNAIEINKRRAKKYFNCQGYLFYIGILLFVLWHILEMFLLSNLANNS